MNKLLLPFLFFFLLSCLESDMQQIETEQPEQIEETGGIVVTDVFGREYPELDPSMIYCGPGWGTKMCHFLHKYDGTVWADAENYHSEYPDIKFSNFWDRYFISFLDVDKTASCCEGWKLGETIEDGIKWNIKIKRDQEDVFWLNYEYYGAGQEIESTITYKYEVIDGLLHFSNTNGQVFNYRPSQRNYAEDSVDTEDIIVKTGCLFY